MVLVPVPPRRPQADGSEPTRDTSGRLAEAFGLARAIDLDVRQSIAVPLASYRPATLLGQGKVEEIAGQVAADDIGLVVVDHALTPVQQRNLERAWKTKVIDRTGLILEIFGERANTREGRLQVELAHLNYQKSRLVRSWTHLERQRGGFGFLGGPGETQIEADRRLIQERISRIERELEGVVRTRRLQRENRKRVPHPIVALVGYTNAGKSTLFNTLTTAKARAEDLLFATLDPTLRRLVLPHGVEVILSDTVGFVSDLPTHLVAAFRATLEEVVEADLILHVRDIAHPETEAQAADVTDVLGQLGIDARSPDRIIEIWNKIDLLPKDGHPAQPSASDGRTRPTIVPISALTGEGIPDLLAAIEALLLAPRNVYRLSLSGESTARLHEIYRLGEILERRDEEDGAVHMVVRVGSRSDAVFRRAFPDAVLEAKGARPAAGG